MLVTNFRENHNLLDGQTSLSKFSKGLMDPSHRDVQFSIVHGDDG